MMNWLQWHRLTLSSVFSLTILTAMSVSIQNFKKRVKKFRQEDDFFSARFTVGQNIAIQFSTKVISASNWTSQIASWYSEVTSMDKALVKKFP